MKVILHIIDIKDNIRSHLAFYNNKDFKNIFMIPPKTYDKQKLDNYIEYKKTEECYNYVAKNKIDIIIVSNDIFSLRYHVKIKNRGIKLYRIYHGIPIESYIQTYKVGLINKYRYYNGIFCPLYMKMILDKYKKHNNYIGLDGLTQFEYIKTINLCEKKDNFKKKYNIENEFKYILFLTNNKSNHVKEYQEILKILLEIKKKGNYYLIVKIKQNSKLSQIIKNKKEFLEIYKKNNNLLLINNNSLITDYLFSDIIISQSAGTSFFDALIINRPVIYCNIMEKYDFFSIKKKFNNLMIGDNETNINKCVMNIIENKYDTELYKHDRLKILKQYFGECSKTIEFIYKYLLK